MRTHTNQTKKKYPDRSFFLLTIALVVIGLLAVADASAPQAQTFFHDAYFYVKQQAVWAIVGIVALVIISQIHYSVWKKFAVPMFFCSVAALVIVLIPGFGSKFLGARRWITIGPIGIQPSELVKMTLAIYFASLADAKKELKSYLVTLGLVGGLIMLQPDLGTTIIVIMIGLIQLFLSGISVVSLLSILGASVLAGGALVVTSEYRRERLLTFLGATSDKTGTSYHIHQVLIALGSGGLFGVGLGQSRQKYLFLPESATDSVFAVIAEEVGFIGAFILICLFLLFLYQGLKIAQKAPDKFSKILASGIIAWIGVQFFLNISSMVAVTPLTGVPLPFFSYGGSSLTMILIGVGILLNISKYAKE
jgi:cell division protein FtsW